MVQRSEIVRWTVSCVTVVVCYAAAATAILAWEPHYEAPSAPLTIAMIDLAPLPPEPTPPPPAPPPPPEPEIIPEPPPEVKVEVPLPPVKKPPPPKVKREEPPPEPAPPSPPVETAAMPAPAPAPRVAARVDPSPNIMATYLAHASAHVKKNLRYPLASLRRNERGTAYVLVTINKSGKVLSYKLDTGTNRRLLDEEALAVVLRSDPMPAVPPEIDRDEILLRFPIEFNLR